MNKLSTTIITIIVLLIISYGAYDLYLNYELKEEITHEGFKGEARKNSYYASRLFLKRMGIPTTTKTSLQSLGSLPDTDTVLIITTRRTTLSPKKTKSLINWVKSGGHLIALATHNWKYSGSSKDKFDNATEDKLSPDPLQRFMGVHTGSKLLVENIDDKNEDYTKHTIALQGVDRTLELSANRYRGIYVDNKHKNITEEIKRGSDNYIVRQKIGKGLVTLITDIGFMTNAKIELKDHAEILWQLIHGLHKPINQPNQVWLVHNDKMPPLWRIIWRNYWAFVISLTLLLLFWLIKNVQRFGPMIPKQEENRRSLNEHISSSGNFYWKNDKKQLLIDSSRKALMQRLSQIHPGWSQYNKEEQISLLVKQFEIKAESIDQLLYAQNIENSDEFTELIRQLEGIRQKI